MAGPLDGPHAPAVGQQGTQLGLLMLNPRTSATGASNITIAGANGTIDVPTEPTRWVNPSMPCFPALFGCPPDSVPRDFLDGIFLFLFGGHHQLE